MPKTCQPIATSAPRSARRRGHRPDQSGIPGDRAPRVRPLIEGRGRKGPLEIEGQHTGKAMRPQLAHGWEEIVLRPLGAAAGDGGNPPVAPPELPHADHRARAPVADERIEAALRVAD